MNILLGHVHPPQKTMNSRWIKVQSSCFEVSRTEQQWNEMPGVTIMTAGATPCSQSDSQSIQAGFLGRIDTFPFDKKPKLLGRFLQQRGISALEGLVGDFVIWVHDKISGTFYLLRDPMGIYPLYWSQCGKEFFFANTMSPLLSLPGVGLKPDLLGIRTYQGDCSVVSDRTCFEGVRCFIPGTLYVVSDSIRKQINFLKLSPFNSSELKTVPEIATVFKEKLSQAVNRRLKSQSGIYISGGLDSSAIACLSWKNDSFQTWGVHYTSPAGSAGDESDYLEMLRALSPNPIKKFPFSASDDLLADLRDNVLCVESPFVDSFWRSSQMSLAWMQHRGIKTVLSGDWGDQILHSRGYLLDLLLKGRLRRCWQHLRALQQWDTHNECAGWGFELFMRLIARILPVQTIKSLKRLWLLGSSKPGSDEFLRFESMKMMTHQAADLQVEATSRYTQVCLEWHHKAANQFGISAAFPFLDQDFIEFLMGIEPHLLAGTATSKGLLRASMVGVLPEPIRLRKGKGDYSDQENDLIMNQYSKLSQFFKGPLISSKFKWSECPPMASKQDIATAGHALNAWQIVDIAGLELWLRQYRRYFFMKE